jgi:hypothetical protein
MAAAENPYRASQQPFVELAPATHGWKEGPYLVVHVSKSALPNRCLFCDGPPVWRGRLSIRKRVSWPFLVAVLLIGPLALFLFLVMPRARVLASLCASDATSVKLRKLAVYVPLVCTVLSLVGAMLVSADVITAGGDFAIFFVFILSAFALLIGLLLALVVSRHVTVFREQRNYF